MAYSIKVDTGDVASKAATVKSQAATLESQISTLTKDMQALSETWTGSASAAFQSLYQQWKTQATTIQNQLDSISASLKGAGSNYDSVESQTTSALSK